MEFSGKKVTVVGTGISGIGAVGLLNAVGAEVVLYDGNEKLKIEDIEKKLGTYKAEIVLGELTKELTDSSDLLVISPGVPIDSPVVKAFEAAGVPVWGEVELAYAFDKGKVLAITGTNGKTTTTALVGQIVGAYHKDTFVVGNIGNPYTTEVLKSNKDSYTVAEISSFQLETVHEFHPLVSAILNITPDHLDRHHTMEAYIRAKESITKCQTKEDTCVLNYEDEILRKFAETLKVNVLFFSSKRPLEEGIYLQENTIWIAGKETERQRLIDVGELKLLGIHNYENVMAASGTALCMGAPIDVVQRVLKEFWGVKHRIEFVRDLHGVLYYNDSKATNPDAAIRGIGSMNRKTLLIGGGYDKNLEFDAWIESFDGKVKCLLLIGQTKDKIAVCARKHGFENIVCCDTLNEAVNICYRLAKPGEAVLLSPACASWGDFKDYTQRGELFRQYVMELPE